MPFLSAMQKCEGSKTPHVHCGEEAEQQCWALKSPTEGAAQRGDLLVCHSPEDVTQPGLIQRFLQPRNG